MSVLYSGTVTAGTDATATQYNNLRKDVASFGGDYAATTGSANAYVLAVDAQVVAYLEGQRFRFKANFTNTGAATINVNAIGAKSIVKTNGNALQSGDIGSGLVCEVVYDGTNMQLVSTLGITKLSQDSKEIYAEDAGGTDAYAITLTPSPVSYYDGQVFSFKANTANTGTATLNVNAIGAKNIYKNGDMTLATGDIKANQQVTVIYNESLAAAAGGFQMQSPPALTNKITTINADVTVNTTTTETDLVSVTVSANTLGTGNAIRGRLYLKLLNGATDPATPTFRLKYGATTITSIGANLTSGDGNASGYLDFLIIGAGTTSSQEGSMTCFTSIGGRAAVDYFFSGEGTAAEDNTADKTLAISVQWDTSNAGNTVTMAHAVIEKII